MLVGYGLADFFTTKEKSANELDTNITYYVVGGVVETVRVMPDAKNLKQSYSATSYAFYSLNTDNK